MLLFDLICHSEMSFQSTKPFVEVTFSIDLISNWTQNTKIYQQEKQSTIKYTKFFHVTITITITTCYYHVQSSDVSYPL